MTKREIVKRALAHVHTAQVPYHLNLSAPIRAGLQKHYGAKDVDEAIGNYMVSFHVCPGRDFMQKKLPGGLYYDEFGSLWQKTESNWGFIR